ncbi:MAG: NAD(P)H-hydrate epimerase [Pirellulaceae bacterium]|jgi:NAD(P)H-hydrate epimerase|nr:NAD(P)H-hydrate epimerase [Thermoguttaceae bacterium]MDI9446599.1 NAD(P)H-hydrate epimerase [Planctomycetota bacterium]NLZ01067.1 NAD(P)H-hydrate epimerase [Pirellulaceae bacterium]
MKTPALTRDESRQVDRRAMEVYGISGLVLMENAGRGVVDWLEALGIRKPVVICCGRGNNGGDGFVIARHLAIRGYPARVLLWADPQDLAGDAAVNFRILQKCGVPIDRLGGEGDPATLEKHLAGAGWIVDALLGTGARGEPRPPLDQAIDRINAAGVPVLAVDVPSGLDCESGEPARHTIRAAHTCTFVARKIGFAAEAARPWLGEVHVLDIGAPWRIVEEVVSRRSA